MPRSRRKTVRVQGQPKHIHLNELVNGMLVEFNYSSGNDKRPMILFLYMDNDLAHGINLNYLPSEKTVQNLFEDINKITGIQLGDETNVGKKYTSINLNHKKTPGNISSKQFYDKFIKKFLKKYPNCYRTYKSSNMSNIKTLDYKLDVIEDAVRKQTKLSKYRVSTPEVHKAISDMDETITVKKKGRSS